MSNSIDLSTVELYSHLGLEKFSSASEVTRAYKEKARQVHPDKNLDDPGATFNFQLLQKVFEILGDDSKRGEYDAALRARGDRNVPLPSRVPDVVLFKTSKRELKARKREEKLLKKAEKEAQTARHREQWSRRNEAKGEEEEEQRNKQEKGKEEMEEAKTKAKGGKTDGRQAKARKESLQKKRHVADSAAEGSSENSDSESCEAYDEGEYFSSELSWFGKNQWRSRYQ